MNPDRGAILRELGLAPLWRLRNTSGDAEQDSTAVSAPSVPVPPADAAADATTEMPAEIRRERVALQTHSLDWEQLEAEIHSCTACPLHIQRNKPVPGIGDRRPDWLMIGEGPGAEEDRRGEPFVGPAGQLLDAMLASVGLSRSRGAFIANAVKCRPPNNRTPETSEIETCFPYLERQVALLRPRLIVALGRPAAQSLLKQDIRIAAVRGRQFSFSGIPVIITYHPAYLLRNPQDKSKAWEDLCFARRLAPPRNTQEAQR